MGFLLSGGVLMARERTAMLILLRKVVLNQEQGCPPGDIRRYLKTCLVVTAGDRKRMQLVSTGQRLRTLAVQHPAAKHRTDPAKKNCPAPHVASAGVKKARIGEPLLLLTLLETV